MIVSAMSVVLNISLPVFAIIAAGVVLGRFNVLGPSSSEALNRYVFVLALPAALFLGIAKAPLAATLNWPFLGAFLGALVASYAAAALIGHFVFGERSEVLCLEGVAASFPNTAYMGFPLFLAAFGPDRLGPAIVSSVATSILIVSITSIWMETLRNRGDGLRRTFANIAGAVARNPLIAGSAGGLAWAALLPGVRLPTPVATFCELVGASAGPCALFAIGLFLSTRPFRADFARTGWVLALKLLFQPLVAWALVTWVFPLDPFWAAATVIVSALPTGTTTFVIAQQYQVYVERSSTVILLSTILSIVTLTVLLAAYAA